MHYALLVLSSPIDGNCLLSAVRFAGAVIAKGHTLDTVFFSDAATAVGLKGLAAPQDEVSNQAAWQTLAREHDIDLVLCVASAMQRGVHSVDDLPKDSALQSSLAEGFRIGGLGQLVSATHVADRVLTFGG